MKLQYRTRRALTLAGLAGTLACGSTAFGQSADALIDKLVDKGVLTVKEANDLREEADKNFSTAHSVKTGMPDWVTAFKINGDLRGRYEGFFYDNPRGVDQNRFRYRARLGFTAVLKDAFEVGLRLGSGDLDGGIPSSGLDPISNNQSLQNNGSKKGIFLDLAYGKWAPLNTPEWSGGFTLGKMENPFVFPSTMMFDRDYTPEGGAMELTYRPGSAHALKFTGAAYMLDEVGGNSLDPYLLAAQVRWDATWSKRLASSLGVSGWDTANESQLMNPTVTTGVPDRGGGNTRTAGGALVNNYNPIQTDGALTYTLDSFPMYNAAFPITAFGEYINNPAVKKNAEGYAIGLMLGKSGKRGLWDISYQYRVLEGDAWWEELTESDFGAYYQTAKTGGGAGYRNGTNVRGHIIKGQYSPFDSLTLTVQYFLTELIDENPAGSESGTGRLQVDATLKF